MTSDLAVMIGLVGVVSFVAGLLTQQRLDARWRRRAEKARRVLWAKLREGGE